MTPIDARNTHLAVCRYRRQGLACSTCSDLTERADRYAEARERALAESR